MSEKFAIGVDLGGSHVAAGAVSCKGEVSHRVDRDIKSGKPAVKIIKEDIWKVISDCKELVEKDGDEVIGIGIGIPGRTDSENGICVYAPNLKWRDVAIVSILNECTQLPVFILNDVRGMAVGEKLFGNGVGVRTFISIAIGTGIGGGIVIDHKLHLGNDEGAGEIGHITVEPDGPVCGCGNQGCVEALASGPAIVARTEKLLPEYPDSILQNQKFLSPKIIFEAAEESDPLALKIWHDTGCYLGRMIAALMAGINPQRVLFSGKVSGAIKYFLPGIREELKKRAKMFPENTPEIMVAKFKDNAGIVGNGARVFEKLELC